MSADSHEDDEDLEKLLEEDASVVEPDEEDDDKDNDTAPGFDELMDIVHEDIEDMIEIVETDLSPCLDGLSTLLGDVNPELATRAKPWLDRTAAFCDKLVELRGELEKLVEEAKEMSSADEELEDMMLGL